MEVNLWELRRLLTARVHESIGRGHNRINMVRARLGRPWGRVKGGVGENQWLYEGVPSDTPTDWPVKSAARAAEVIVQTIDQGSGS